MAEVARATLGRARLADGNLLIAARAGEQERVVRALKRKLTIIRRLHEHVLAHGWIAVMQDGKTRRYEVRFADESVIQPKLGRTRV